MRRVGLIIVFVGFELACIRPPEHVPTDPFDTGPDSASPADAADTTTVDSSPDADADTAGGCPVCPDAELCDPVSGRCVGCLDHDDCASGACEPITQTCVECVDPSSCIGRDASRCAANFTCQPCESRDDCTHIAGRPVCADGECVECDSDDTVACGTRACNPRTNLCTQNDAQSLGPCAPCETDSECEPGSYCVAMEFGSELLHDGQTGYCLVEYTGGTCAATTRWEQPTANVPSLDDITRRNFCAPSTTTCAAVIDWGSACTTDADCGLGISDGRCLETAGVAGTRCTWPCESNQDCPPNIVCGDGEEVCGRL